MTTVQVELKELTAKDVAAVIEFSKKTGAQTDNLSYGSEGVELSIEQEEHYLTLVQNSENQLMLGAYVGDQLVGVLSVSALQTPRLAHIGEVGVSVLQEYWGYGMGTLLIEEAIYWAHEVGIKRLTLEVRVDNHRAIHLYKKCGFQTEGVATAGLCVNNEYIDVYRMAYIVEERNSI